MAGADQRGSGERGLLIGFDEVRLLLDPYAFTTEVFFEPDAVSIGFRSLAVRARRDLRECGAGPGRRGQRVRRGVPLRRAAVSPVSQPRGALPVDPPGVRRERRRRAGRRAVRGARGRARAGCRRLPRRPASVLRARRVGGASARAGWDGRSPPIPQGAARRDDPPDEGLSRTRRDRRSRSLAANLA